MSIVAWLLIGLVAGLLAGKLANQTNCGLGTDIVLGLSGALFGGCIFDELGKSAAGGFDPGSLLQAFVGAVLVLAAHHAAFNQRVR